MGLQTQPGVSDGQRPQQAPPRHAPMSRAGCAGVIRGLNFRGGSWPAWRRGGRNLLWLALAGGIAFSVPALDGRAQPQDELPPHRPDQILVRVKHGVGAEAVARLHAAQRSRVARVFPGVSGLQIVRLSPATTVAESLRRYRASGLVAYAEPDYQVQAARVPNDPYYLNGSLWALENWGQTGGTPDADIDAPEAWDTAVEARRVIVAVLDSGVRYTHEDLAGNLWVNPRDGSPGFNALNGSNHPVDDCGHGTLVAGVVGAVGNNGKGVTGVAWRAQIMACKCLDAAGNGFVSDAIACIEFARSNGAHIINASWGGFSYSAALADAIAGAGRQGIIFVAAAGNQGTDADAQPFYPASYALDNLVSVAASTASDTLASFSNYGARRVALAAPGYWIYSTAAGADNAYAPASGTSLAAAFVSGALALLRAADPDASSAQLIARLLETTDLRPGLTGKCRTGGRLNLANALNPRAWAVFQASPLAGALPLTVSFTDASQGVVTQRVWDFGDGTAATNEVCPTHVFTREGSFPVTLTVTSDQGTTTRTTQTIQAVANYAIQPAGFAWVDPNLMAPLPLNSNGVSAPVNLPFPFYFYGKRYAQVVVAANGVLGFGSQPFSLPVRRALPDTNAPRAIVCPFWTDLDAAVAGQVRVAVRGSAPRRQVVFAWTGPDSSGPELFGFQVVLFESTQRILFQYLASPDDLLGGLASARATIGVGHESGQVAAVYALNGSSLTNRQAIVFVPASRIGVTNFPVALLTPPARGPDGRFRLQLTGQPASVYVIETAGNLPHWSPLSTGATDLEGWFRVADPTSPTEAFRLYRARFVP